MAEVCKDIDKGLSDLQAAMKRLNNRLDDLERKQKQCRNNKNNQNNNSNNNDLEK